MRVRTAAAALSLVALVSPVGGEILEQILVKVNGDIITKTDLEQRQIAALRQRNQPATESDLRSDEALKKLLADLTPEIIVEVVDETLLMQRGKELGYRLSDEQFKSIIENIKKENKIESDGQFDAALKQEGMTMADLRRTLERQMLIQRVQQTEVFGRISITEEEARQYYARHPQDFTSAATVTLREVLISVPEQTDLSGGSKEPTRGINVGLEEEIEAKANAARDRIIGGEEFAKVAAEFSDAASKANGGLVGPINLDDLASDVRGAVDKLRLGEVSGVIRTPRGYQFFKLESAMQSAVAPFERVRDQIAEKVFAQRRQGEFDKYLKKLRSEAIIEWKNAELKKAYEQRLAALENTPPASE
ncbi:MAG: peptidylprolyl isomerase [Acidobacteria bacterium]|nr:peptidylprolyl isomerase [Acidobacteriota bacterium]